MLPEANAPEAAVVEGIQVFPIRSVKEAWDFLISELIIPPFYMDRRAFSNAHRNYVIAFDVRRWVIHPSTTILRLRRFSWFSRSHQENSVFVLHHSNPAAVSHLYGNHQRFKRPVF